MRNLLLRLLGIPIFLLAAIGGPMLLFQIDEWGENWNDRVEAYRPDYSAFDFLIDVWWCIGLGGLVIGTIVIGGCMIGGGIALLIGGADEPEDPPDEAEMLRRQRMSSPGPLGDMQ